MQRGKNGKNRQERQKLECTKVHGNSKVGSIIAHQQLTVATNVKGVSVNTKLLCN